jgi:hypothetical protein
MRLVLVGLLLQATSAFTPPGRLTHTLTTAAITTRQVNKYRLSKKPSLSTTALGHLPRIELSNLFYDSSETAFSAWEWTANLGAPAALVAGAVLVTLSETREAMGPRKNDKKWIRAAKQTYRFLILSSFALEVVSIFVSTVTGSVLLSHGPAKKVVGYTSPLALLLHHHEFEYLTIQIAFLQGLFNWLLAVATEIIIPKENETKSARRMNKCMASWLVTLIFWITAFYNNHLAFYSDYSSMLRRYATLFAKRYIFEWPPRPMSLLYGPSFVVSVVLALRAFQSPPEEDVE